MVHQKISNITEGSSGVTQEQKRHKTVRHKTENRKTAGINPTLLVITSNIKGLNTPIRDW